MLLPAVESLPRSTIGHPALHQSADLRGQADAEATLQSAFAALPGPGPLRNQPSFLLGQGRVEVERNGSPSRPGSATMSGTRWAIRPETNATSRESRSSLETNDAAPRGL